jgi:hypothetical protein
MIEKVVVRMGRSALDRIGSPRPAPVWPQIRRAELMPA